VFDQVGSGVANLRVIYISQGNIPSKWAHTFQAMKMAEALAQQAASLTLLTGGGLLDQRAPAIDLAEWYDIGRPFRVVRLPVHLRLAAPLFAGYRYPRFDRAAAIYARLQSPDLVFARSPYAGYLCAKLGLRTILETHVEKESPEFRHMLAACRLPHLLGIVTVTPYSKSDWVLGGIPESKILVWPDAVDVSRFSGLAKPEARRELGLPPMAKIAVYSGHFYEHKGVSYFIEAARYLPDVLFRLVGGWPEDIERCRQQAAGLENVSFAGFVPARQVAKNLAAADFLLLPNSMRHRQAHTTSPLKLFEYMAARRPVIASNIPAFQGILQHRRNAYLVEPDSAAAIVAAIQTLDADADFSDRLAGQAWQDVQQFTWERRVADILSHFLDKPERPCV
jgi:glycosyltransferase involved in cell wall biosynthesis